MAIEMADKMQLEPHEALNSNSMSTDDDSSSSSKSDRNTNDLEQAAALSGNMDSSSPSSLTNQHGKHGDFGQRPDCFRNTVQEVLFVLMATIAQATNTFFQGTCMVMTASIGRSLDMSQGQITWIGAATTLTAGAFQLPLGQLSDLLGRRAFFLLGFAGVSLSCLVLAFARDPFWMDSLCGLVGLFSAVLVPPAIGILGAAYEAPSRRKNWAFASFSAGNPLGAGLGAVASGVAARVLDWRAGFFFMAIVWALLTVVAFWVVPKGLEAYDSEAPFRQRLVDAMRRFDALGTALTIFGVGLLTASLTLGSSDGWKSGHVIAMLVVGFVLIVAFIVWEAYCDEPLMPLHIWKDRNFSLITAAVIAGMMGFQSSVFWLTLMMQEILRYSPLATAVHILPQVIAGITWNVVVAGLLHRVNNTLILAAGAVAYLAAQLLLALQRVEASYWAFVFPAIVILVIGADWQFNVANMYVMHSLPRHQQGLAGGIFNMLIRLGTSVALGISTAVYSAVAVGVDGDGTNGSVSQPPPALDRAFTPFKAAFYVGVGFSALACAIVPFVRLGTQGNGEHTEWDEKKEKQPDGEEPAILDSKGVAKFGQ